jgi:hypothetical protein
MPRTTHPRRPAVVAALLAVLAAAGSARAQPATEPVPATVQGSVGAEVPELRVTDPRLAAALEVLVAASPTAARALEALGRSGLPVAIGTPAQLAALPESAGGPDATERRLLLAAEDESGPLHESPVASVMFRAAGASGHGAEHAPAGLVERVWIAVEVDSVEAWIRGSGQRDADVRIQHDLLAILAHEFVAHVGSVAGTRRMEDLCDDPSPEQRRRSAEARARGEMPPLDGEMASCALRVENRVRGEVNRSLRLRGSRALPPRYGYSLEVMHFARVRASR